MGRSTTTQPSLQAFKKQRATRYPNIFENKSGSKKPTDDDSHIFLAYQTYSYQFKASSLRFNGVSPNFSAFVKQSPVSCMHV